LQKKNRNINLKKIIKTIPDPTAKIRDTSVQSNA
jgi:hypothetical protein